MKMTVRTLKLAAGAILFAVAMVLLMSAPGLLTVQDSVVPVAKAARQVAR